MRTIGQRARPAALWSLAEIVARQAVLLATTVLLARLLTPTDFGLIAMVLVFTAIGATLVDAGLGTALIQRAAVDRDDEATAFRISIACGFVFGGFLFLAAPAIASLYQEPRLSDVVRLMALVLPLTGLGVVPDALLTRRLAFRERAKAEVVASTAAGAVAIALAVRGHGAWSLAWQTVIGCPAALFRAKRSQSYGDSGVTSWPPICSTRPTRGCRRYCSANYRALANWASTTSPRMCSKPLPTWSPRCSTESALLRFRRWRPIPHG
jgi:O-antigen/teichoic acid export membrane protein